MLAIDIDYIHLKKGFQQNFKFAVAIHKTVDCGFKLKQTKERISNQ